MFDYEPLVAKERIGGGLILWVVLVNQNMEPLAEHHPQGHTIPSITNINEQMASKQTRGERVADMISAVIGSWPFIIIQSCFLVAWIVLTST